MTGLVSSRPAAGSALSSVSSLSFTALLPHPRVQHIAKTRKRASKFPFAERNSAHRRIMKFAVAVTRTATSRRPAATPSSAGAHTLNENALRRTGGYHKN
jgi:hypothetical protein